ncbi:RsiV family protein [Kushneria sp. TE3]|uniref:RsiV family protein n=1 Tax=Kushneria sp. TE3 TaxID=3449832 RepID=UPI003F6853E0
MMTSTRYRWLAVPALLLTLTACDQTGDDQTVDDRDSASTTIEATDTPDQQQGLSPTFVNRTLTPPDCEGDDCASVEVRTVEFDNDPALTDEVARRLVRMGSPISDASVDEDALPATVDAYAEDFFDQSARANEESDNPRPYHTSLEASQIGHHDDLLVLELQSYVMTGGAHGLPGTAYMVIDERTRQIVTLDDMLKPGQKPAFEAALESAWQRWMKDSEQARDLDPEDWPFSPSDNAAPLEDNMAVTYGVYTLGPYAIGQPTLTIPYSDLDGVLKPRFVPEADARQH